MAFKTETPNGSLLKANTETSKLVDTIGVTSLAVKQLEKELNEKKTQLRTLAKQAYWDHNFQEDDIEHTFDVPGRTCIAQLNFENSYHLNKDRYDQVKAILGDNLEGMLQERPVVNIDVNDLDPETRVEFYRAIKEICDEYSVEGFVDEKYVVSQEFHDARHELIPRVNHAIDAVLPVTVAITI